MRPFHALAVAILASSCATTIDTHTPAPANWPKLEVRDHVVSGWEVQRRCYGYLSTAAKLVGAFPMACAEINFAAGTCDIWRAHDASPEILEHEHDHCAGRDHPGESTLRDAWAQHLQQARTP